MTEAEIIEAIARAIVEAKGEAADSPVSRHIGTQWVEHGPLWKVEGIPIAEPVLAALRAHGMEVVPVEAKPVDLVGAWEKAGFYVPPVPKRTK